MIKPSDLLTLLKINGIDFFTGVPDSQLKEFCAYLLDTESANNHVIAPNEGSAAALAAGYHLATGKTGLVYMQNSGLGNAVNPMTSLADPDVYGIPVVYLIGWRGRPGVHDEPQHIKQGKITCELLDLLGIKYVIIDKATDKKSLEAAFTDNLRGVLDEKKSVALVAMKDCFESETVFEPVSNYSLCREEAIAIIVSRLGTDDVVVSTTGKISRELYETRKKTGMGHGRDFLTVGSMGHASMIALAISEQKPNKRVWCFDGDGAAIMHLGAVLLTGSRKPKNLIHVLFNNQAHESVGGFPTASVNFDFIAFAKTAGYSAAFQVEDEQGLISEMRRINSLQGPVFMELNVANSSRSDLGRPVTTPVRNKEDFMNYLRG